ncbi:hypothetical protein KDN32_10365 [Nocardioides sp. J2M5]|uniref:hypothetical protein n=1 Tax=Nocardioides palaemonis TaxID=2829810 RepID=UPI001BA46630|nr:hypothetical protein [Nocardioides palaemonis]MBS2938147.1 hypothetical protein [Nocardioides palaemonis]
MTAPPTDVVDRLERLAAHAPAHGVDADAVWSRGRRRQRLRGAAAVAAVLVVGLLGATTAPLVLQRVQDAQVADAAASMVLPDLLRQPGGWEPAFPEAPGRLSAVGFGTRSGLWSSRAAWWGVSATTGESRFLDLPDAADTVDAPALSADGWRLAYWVTGEVPGEPLTMGGPTVEDTQPAVGVAVLDLRTGDRDVWRLDTEHGLATNGLAWAGDVLWWSAGQVTRFGETAVGGTDIATRRWDFASGERGVPTGAEARVSPLEVRSAPDGFVAYPRRRGLVVVSGDERRTLDLVLPSGAPPSAGVVSATLSPDGASVVALLRPDATVSTGEPDQLVVGAVEDGVVRLRVVDDVLAFDVLGWRSPSQVVVASVAEGEDGRPSQVLQASSLDLGTGETTDLLEVSGNTPQVAADAWAAELVPAPDPPFAPDPRLVGVGVLVAGLALWRVLRWRGRRGHA